ncbi:MAG: DUF4349 domain-containing protein, partial [Pirellulales bacterium]|nr:DUF4349 domain-containing protein [Pirellulales bacterium]
MVRLALLSLLVFAGCSSPDGVGMSADESASKMPEYDAKKADSKRSGKDRDRGNATPDTKSASSRKIIYSANVNLAVEDFSGIPARVSELVNEHNGYIAGNSLSAESGSDRSGSWKLRVPTDQFDAFMEHAK